MYQPPPPFLETDAPLRKQQQRRTTWGFVLSISGVALAGASAVIIGGSFFPVPLLAAFVLLISGILGQVLFFIGVGLTIWSTVADARRQVRTLRGEPSLGSVTTTTLRQETSGSVEIKIDPGMLSSSKLGAGFGIGLAALFFFAAGAGTAWEIVHGWTWPALEIILLVTGLAGTLLFMADLFLPPRRLLAGSGPFVGNWTSEGLEAPLYPYNLYKSEGAGFRLSSRIFQMTVALLKRPNVVPWRLLKVVVYRYPWGWRGDMALVALTASMRPWWFSGERIGESFLPTAQATGAWSIPGFPTGIPIVLLPSALQTAVDGDAALFVEAGCLSEMGKQASVGLTGRFSAAFSRPISGPRFMPMPRSHSTSGLKSWLSANSASK